MNKKAGKKGKPRVTIDSAFPQPEEAQEACSPAMQEMLRRHSLLERAWQTPFLTADFKQVLPLQAALGTFDRVAVDQRLDRIRRFCGAGYSVAQHQRVAAEQLLSQPGESDGAFRARKRAVELHDVEEAILGDIPRPVLDILELFGLDRALWLEFQGQVRAALQANVYGEQGLHHLSTADADNRALAQEVSSLRERFVESFRDNSNKIEGPYVSAFPRFNPIPPSVGAQG